MGTEATDTSKLIRTIELQAKEIAKLNRSVMKLERGTTTSLNKDKTTFLQAFKRRCDQRGWLPYWKDVIGGKVPTWKDITTDNVEQYIAYLKVVKSKRLNKPIQPTTQNLYIAELRSLIKWGETPLNNTVVLLKQRKTVHRRKVWLHPEELDRLYTYNFPNYEASTWKYFMICCLLGCRIADAQKITLNNLDGNTVRYNPIKTRDTECYIRLSDNQVDMLKEFLEIKNYGYMPTNETLREIFRKNGLIRTFDIGTYGISEVKNIADVVHFHTARHTFATIKYRYSDYTEREIAIAVGHKTFKQTWDNYICDKTPLREGDKKVKGLFI